MNKKTTQKITPCLWFDDQAEAAVKFYTSIFKNSKKGIVTRYDEETAKVARRPAGSILTITFELNGHEFMALNGGPMFKFSEAISFMIYCRNQRELDYYWAKLSAGGKKQPCGWLKDKFGLSWQVVPREMDEMMKDPEVAARVMKVVLQMEKIDIAAVKRAAAGKEPKKQTSNSRRK